MCAVAAIPAIVGLAISAASTGVSMGLQADASQKAAAEKERAARQNALYARYQREGALETGVQQGAMRERQGRQVAAAARTQAAQSGVATTEGSLANRIAMSEVNAQADADAIRSKAARQAWGYDTQSQDYLAAGRSAREAGYLGSISAGVAGAGRLGQLAAQGGSLVHTYA